MAFRKLILLCLVCIIASAPAFAFAAGCCCLKTTQTQSMMMQDQDAPPCHDMTDNTEHKTVGNNVCLCDAGLLTISDHSAPLLSETNYFHKTAYVLDTHNPYASFSIIPEIRPPIS